MSVGLILCCQAETRVFAEQRGLDERLGRRLVEIDTSLQRVRIDTHASVVGLRDVATSIERLEAKLDKIGGAMNKGDGAQNAPPQPDKKFAKGGGVWHLPEGGHATQDMPEGSADGDFDFEHQLAGQQSPQSELLQDMNSKLEWIAEKLEQVLVTRTSSEFSTQDFKKSRERPSVLRTQQVKKSRERPLKAADIGLADFDSFSTRQAEPQHNTDLFQTLEKKLEWISKKLDLVSTAVGAETLRTGANAGDDEEDRKRLKEKLKDAIVKDRRSRFRKVEPEHEVWLEYVFGICKPDQRAGKRGSRFVTLIFLVLLIFAPKCIFHQTILIPQHTCSDVVLHTE